MSVVHMLVERVNEEEHTIMALLDKAEDWEHSLVYEKAKQIAKSLQDIADANNEISKGCENCEFGIQGDGEPCDCLQFDDDRKDDEPICLNCREYMETEYRIYTQEITEEEDNDSDL